MPLGEGARILVFSAVTVCGGVWISCTSLPLRIFGERLAEFDFEVLGVLLS